MKLLLTFALLAVCAFAQQGDPIGPTGTLMQIPADSPLLVPATDGASQVIPNTVSLPVEIDGGAAGQPGVAGPIGPAIAVTVAPPAKLTRKARFNLTVKTAALVVAVVVILAARVYAAGHPF
jgi:hypothetical protein